MATILTTNYVCNRKRVKIKIFFDCLSDHLFKIKHMGHFMGDIIFLSLALGKNFFFLTAHCKSSFEYKM